MVMSRDELGVTFGRAPAINDASDHPSIAECQSRLLRSSVLTPPSMKYVLLLRAPAEDGPDRYEVVFEARGYVPLSVPVLETVLVHVDVLRDKIIRGPKVQGLSGVIMTSKRAVEAWCDAIRSISPPTDVAQGG